VIRRLRRRFRAGTPPASIPAEMYVIAALLLVMHGIAHLVGVRAAFWPTAIQLKRRSYLGRRLDGLMWLLLTFGFLGTAGLLLFHQEVWTALLLWSVAGSFVLCLLSWPEARIGLLVNVLLFILVLLLTPGNRGAFLLSRLEREVQTMSLSTSSAKAELVDEASVATLPAAVQRYLRFMGVVGRPRDWSLRAQLNAHFRRDTGDWLECQALQYDRRQPLARVFLMQLSLRHLLPVTVRDTYGRGHGIMTAKAFDLIQVAEGHGHELDVGELVTYLNDAILMAPSLLLGPETTWQAVDARSFDVTLRDSSLSVTARVWLDERGAPSDFSTTDRFFDTEDGRRVRTQWRTPIRGWQDAGGRRLPTSAQAVWMLPSGAFAYADFRMDPAKIAFNVPPVR
jgi:hypothetical protein